MTRDEVLSFYSEYRLFAEADANKMVDCPRCDFELDEDGRLYTCFFCCNQGRVPKYFCKEDSYEFQEG